MQAGLSSPHLTFRPLHCLQKHQFMCLVESQLRFSVTWNKMTLRLFKLRRMANLRSLNHRCLDGRSRGRLTSTPFDSASSAQARLVS